MLKNANYRRHRHRRNGGRRRGTDQGNISRRSNVSSFTIHTNPTVVSP